jgi:hypothetical protein
MIYTFWYTLGQEIEMNWDYKALYERAIDDNARLEYCNGWTKACLTELKSILDSGFIESNENIINKLKCMIDSAENAEKDYAELMEKLKENAPCNDI